VDGVGNSSDIANLFADRYKDLYSSVPYDHDNMASLKVEITSAVEEYNEECVVSFNDVVEAVNSLKHGKNDGFTGLSTDHVINGCDELFVYVSLLFSLMLVHGFAFDDLLVSSIVPILKGKTVLCSDSSNYRGIALSSIFGKVFDRIVINRYYDILALSALQFGFKNATLQPLYTLVMKETLCYMLLIKELFTVLYWMQPRHLIELIIVNCSAVLLTENCHQLF